MSGGRRGEAIREAVEHQLGFTVLDMKPVGLAGSGGSTPLRLHVAGDPDTYLFGKLYAMNHVRADRWYKTGRTHPLRTARGRSAVPVGAAAGPVRGLHAAADAGLRDPDRAPAGIVELTPEREYLLVTEFLDGAHEISEVEVDDAVIDEGLALIRKLWDNGLAHRDIKPANLMVQRRPPLPHRRRVRAGATVAVARGGRPREHDARPRGADATPTRVYEHALRYFTPDEIAEAFAATRGVASPTQLRSVMKQDGRDLVAQFRALAPAAPSDLVATLGMSAASSTRLCSCSG